MTAVEDTPSVADTPASPAAPPSPPLSDALAVVVAGRTLRACQHQVAGHLFESEWLCVACVAAGQPPRKTSA